MTIADLQEFRDALSRYNSNVGGFYAKEKVERVNKAIANINLDGIEDLFAEADVHEHDVCGFVSSLHNSTKNILYEVKQQKHIIKTIMDANVDKVAFFAEQVVEKLEITLNTLKTRRETEPTNEDKSALEDLNGYIAGDYGIIPFDEFISDYITRGLKGVALRRRINYLISQCKDEQINKSLLKHLNKVDCDSAGLSSEEMGKFNNSFSKDFEQKLIDILNKNEMENNKNIYELAQLCPDITVSIKLGELIECNKLLIAETRREFEKQTKQKNTETYPDRAEVMDILGVSCATLLRYEKMGLLNRLPVGGRIRYRMSDVKRFMEGGKKDGEK